MEKPQVLKVFFPQCLLNSNSGLCLGIKDPSTKSVCILAIIHISGHDVITNTDEFCPSYGQNVSLLGMFINRTTLSLAPDISCQDAVIQLEQRYHNGIPECNILQSPWKEDANGFHTVPLFILYDERQVVKMCCSGGSISSANQADAAAEQKSGVLLDSKHVDAISSQVCHHSSFRELDFVVSAVQKFCELCPPKMASGESIPCSSVRSSADSKGAVVLTRICGIFAAIPVFAVKTFLRTLLYISTTRLCTNSIVHSVMTYPATGSQLASKSSQLCRLVRGEANRSSVHKMQFMGTGNVISCVMVDLLLGLMFLVWMYKTNSPPLLADTITTWADQTGQGLQQLLHWLMGAPAGLKLNTSLAHFLGNFFLYHIYLWIGYLNVLLPMMTVLLWIIAGAGILGLSIQLALASDLLSLLTFHIYCFYVYAARIYSLQVSALLSLARLFQGKKWNVLRQRVDHCSYDVDQLFMGTLVFTMLLFMLPTTALFYVVFTLLRLAILILQSLLTLSRDFLHSFPWFSLCLWLTKSDLLNAEAEFQVVDQSPGQPSALILQMQLMPFSDALRFGKYHSWSSVSDKQTFPGIIKKLVRGHLIYPWGGESRS